MNKKNHTFHQNLVLLVFIFFVFTLICSPAIAKRHPTSTLKKNVNVNGDTELNIVLPWGVVVSWHVTNSQGVPEEGVIVTSFGKNFFETNTSVTDKNGNCKLSLKKGTYDFTFSPTSSKSRSVYKTIENVDVKKNTNLNATLDDGVFMSGNLFDFQNQPVTDSIVYAVNQSDNWPSVFNPDPVTGQFKGALPTGKYDITAVRSSCVDLPYQPFRTHTNIIVGEKNIQKDTQLDNIKMPKGVVLQGKVSTKNSQLISLLGTVTDKDNQPIFAVITILPYPDLKDRSPWVGVQTATTSYIDSSYKAALEKKNTYALQVVPFQIAVEGTSINAANNRATYKIINKVKMKNKNKTLNIILDDGDFLSVKVRDKKGNFIKNAAVIITNAKKPKDVFNKNKVMLVAVTNVKGESTYPVPEGKYDVYIYPLPFNQSTNGASHDWNELNTEGEKIQNYLIYILQEFRTNLMARSTWK